VASPEGVRSGAEIAHRPAGGPAEVTTAGWLPDGPVSIGLTSGASTPDNIVEAVIRRLDRFANG
jgi:4-hydroxy-3-methylbut-2-enyl diphosphate reductase